MKNTQKFPWCLFLCSLIIESDSIHSQNGIPMIKIIPIMKFILWLYLSPQMVFLVPNESFFGYQDVIGV